MFSFVDTLANTVHSTVDATKSVASSAVDKGVSFVGSAKGTSLFCLLFIFCRSSFITLFLLKFNFVDTVANTFDATKNVAASAVDTGVSYAASAKGSCPRYFISFYIWFPYFC